MDNNGWQIDIDAMPVFEKEEDYKENYYQVFDRISDFQLEVFAKAMYVISTSDEPRFMRTFPKEVESISAYMTHVQDEIIRKEYRDISHDDLSIVLDRIYNALYGFYVLTPLLKDDAISDIKILGPNHIRVKNHGKHQTVRGIKFLDTDDYLHFLDRLTLKDSVMVQKQPNWQSIFTDLTDKYSRLRIDYTDKNIMSGKYSAIHIRKIPRVKTTMEQLKERGMIDDAIEKYLVNSLRVGTGIMISGKNASGKTTLLNALIDKIDYSKSIALIQESDELFSDNHPDILSEKIYIPRSSRKGEVSFDLSDLTRTSQVQDIDILIIGECKGMEALDIIRQANSGIQFMGTIHADNSRDSIVRLANFASGAPEAKNSSEESLTRAISGTKMLSVYLENYKVIEISKIDGYDDEKHCIKWKPVYKGEKRVFN